ncbi:uncharacterized protein LOC124290418 [Haliotis rubra]|uniref:uncharacterized protein LOC124290418 n=1 Tax=Haliotis rubra TaxID=36100 RepID=UPI001EE56361|nr:uncharacterized protein LOC124290418 [Haliotis rubra]
MIRTSDFYKTTYTEMSRQMKTLEEKLPSVSPALLTLAFDHTKIATTSTSRNSGNRKQKSHKKTLPKVKKSREVEEIPSATENVEPPAAKKTKVSNTKKEKKLHRSRRSNRRNPFKLLQSLCKQAQCRKIIHILSQ